ncbi:hypothetical protein FE772_03650 [Lysobacter enzymogenes]|nr:hypothetical protein [Lysobacter enzymogenes]QCW24899.1 hypothetical protein FE772_03650 [Lysobacter enzymogenes]
MRGLQREHRQRRHRPGARAGRKQPPRQHEEGDAVERADQRVEAEDALRAERRGEHRHPHRRRGGELERPARASGIQAGQLRGLALGDGFDARIAGDADRGQVDRRAAAAQQVQGVLGVEAFVAFAEQAFLGIHRIQEERGDDDRGRGGRGAAVPARVHAQPRQRRADARPRAFAPAPRGEHGPAGQADRDRDERAGPGQRHQ